MPISFASKVFTWQLGKLGVEEIARRYCGLPLRAKSAVPTLRVEEKGRAYSRQT